MLSLPQVFLRFRVAIFLYWSMSCAFLGYWVVYFEGPKGMGAAEIGQLMTLYVSAALAGQYVFGYLSDKLQSIRWPVCGAAVLYAGSVASIPFQPNKSWIYLAIVLLGFLQQPIGPMLDSWTLKHLDLHGQKTLFGKIRSFGSLGWACTGLLTAYLILYLSWNMMFVVAVVAALLLILVVLSIPEVESRANPLDQQRLTLDLALRHLLGNRSYLYILLVVFLMYLGVQTTFNFQGLLIKDAGGGVKELGWTFFLGVMSEMPAMFLSVWLLPRLAARKLMMMAGVLYMLRYGLIIYFQSSWIIMATACLEGLAFGLLLTALRHYIFAVVSNDVQTLAMTVVDATFLGLTVIIGGLVGGWLIERYSPMHMLTACACSSGMALLLILMGGRFDQRLHAGSR